MHCIYMVQIKKDTATCMFFVAIVIELTSCILFISTSARIKFTHQHKKNSGSHTMACSKKIYSQVENNSLSQRTFCLYLTCALWSSYFHSIRRLNSETLRDFFLAPALWLQLTSIRLFVNTLLTVCWHIQWKIYIDNFCNLFHLVHLLDILPIRCNNIWAASKVTHQIKHLTKHFFLMLMTQSLRKLMHLK